MSGINAVYLTGWEYNRVLGTDPVAARNSALPAEILWHGGAYLWLFEHVYCTSDSLANELAADSMMGWRTGRIFAELNSYGILTPLDWASELNAGTRHALSQSHAGLRARYEHTIRDMIAQQDHRRLEQIKIALVEPVARSRGAIVATTPNSLARPNWREANEDDRQIETAERVQLFLAEIAKPLLRSSIDGAEPPMTGFPICSRPGTGIAPDAIARQNEVQRRYEADMIPELLAGEGAFAGANGYEPYFEALMPHRHAYEPINVQLYTNWVANRDRLLALRQIAKRHLWPQLHEEWLPELIANPDSASTLSKKVARAIRRSSRMNEFLTMPSQFVFGVTGASGASIGAVLAQLAQLDLPTATISTLAAGSATTAVAAASKALLDRRNAETRSLALFYQRAIREYRPTPSG